MTKLRVYKKRALADTTGTNNNHHHQQEQQQQFHTSNATYQQFNLIHPQQQQFEQREQNHLFAQYNQQQHHNHHHYLHPQNIYTAANINSAIDSNHNLYHHLIASSQSQSQITMLEAQQPLSQRVTKRRRNRETPPRPLNSFMIYRREYQKRIKEEHPNILLSELSRISKSAADRWANESQQVKQLYAEKAKAEKEKHMKLYPNYVYCPRRPSRTKPRKKATSGSESGCEKMSLNFLLNIETNSFRPYTPC